MKGVAMKVMDAIRTRRSVRKYLNKPIPNEVMREMEDALRLAPSACNFQPWRFILVTDADLRQKVARAANGQMWMADAPVTIVGIGFPDMAYKKMGGSRTAIDIDLAIAIDHLTLAAVAQGLGTCWIGAFDEAKVKDLLAIPADARIVALTPLGYPASKRLNHPVEPLNRKAPVDIFRQNTFSWDPQHPNVE
jgi:nitroreductase